jgi:hypothetical protein
MHEGVNASQPNRDRSLRTGAVVAVALAVAFVVWLLVRGNDSGSSVPPAPTPPATTSSSKPLLAAANLQTLKALPAVVGHPIYWAGRRPRITYELTRTPDDRIYIRYLPKGVKIGDRRAYLIVGTYPVRNAYRAIQTAAKEKGAATFRIAGGGKAVFNKRAPTNVYFAYPRSNYQIEVFAPSPGRARSLVSSGKIRPIR